MKAIKHLRLFSKKSRKEIAEKLNLSISFYGAIEREEKKPSMDTLQAICNVYRIKTFELFFLNEQLNQLTVDLKDKNLKFFANKKIIQILNSTNNYRRKTNEKQLN
jgi:transcriptional regulator with XRE-family HTH domain